MAKGMTIKDALKQFEDDTGLKAKEAKSVKLEDKMIDKMDTSLSQLEACEQLSLSTNRIEEIANLNSLKKLTVLSPVRSPRSRHLRRAPGLTEARSFSLLHMAHNKVAELAEVAKLSSIPTLEDLLLVGNPIEEAKTEEGVWRAEVQKKVPKLKKLDGIVMVGDS